MLVEKFRVELRRWVQVDGASFLPPSMALKVIDHVTSVRWVLAIHQLSNSPDPSCGVWFAHQLSVKVGDLLD